MQGAPVNVKPSADIRLDHEEMSNIFSFITDALKEWEHPERDVKRVHQFAMLLAELGAKYQP